jgi:predicted transcriptional regulator
MRTTVRLDDTLLKEVKRFAIENNQTLTSVIEEALKEKLARREVAKEQKPFRLITAKGRLRPGINISDNTAVRDIMDGVA